MKGLASWALTGLSPEPRPRSRHREAESSSTGATRTAPSSRGALPPLSVPPSTGQLPDPPRKGEDRGSSHRGAGSDLLFLTPHVADTRASVLGSDPRLTAARSVPRSAPTHPSPGPRRRKGLPAEGAEQGDGALFSKAAPWKPHSWGSQLGKPFSETREGFSCTVRLSLH